MEFETLEQQQKLFDEVMAANMNLSEVRAYKKDIAEGDSITPAEWMKQKSLPEADRAAAKAKRISESKESKEMAEFLDDHFPKPPIKK